MGKRSIFVTIFLMAGFMLINVFFFSDTVFAKGITSIRQAEKLAKKQVKGAAVVEVDQDYEKGVLVYEIRLIKGKKEYDLTYRASDAKLICYGWEIQSRYIKAGGGKDIGVSRCRTLAKKQVSDGKILSVTKKYSDGIEVYKVKMQKSNRKYELKFHARTGKLLEYEWELTDKKGNGKNNDYIGREQAKKIALERVGGGTVIKVEFDKDDGVPVYEVEIIKGEFEYEVKIHARTGAVLEVDMDYIYD